MHKINYTNLRMLSLSFLFCVFSIAILPPSVFAVSGDGLIAYPSNPDPNNVATQSWFVYNLDRGTAKEDSLTIKNNSEEKQTLKIYAVDATTNNLGGFALESEADSRDGIGKWISLQENTIILEAQEQKSIKFSINIPPDAKSGEISGGIMVEKIASEEQKKTQSGFIINTRIGIRVYETVPGEIIQKVSFGEASLEYDKKERLYTLQVEINNESNVTVEPEVKIGIKDTFFNIQNSTLEQKPLIPRDGQVKTTFTFKKPRVGKFEIVPALTYQKTDGTKETIVDSKRISFWALPWDEIIIVTLLIIANVLFLIILKILSRKDKKYYKSYKVKSRDDLESIAKKVGADWKSLAKLNKLKPPYKLEAGSIITVFDKRDMLEQLYLENEKITKSTKVGKSLEIKEKTFWSKTSESLWLRKDILVLIVFGSVMAFVAYMLYINLFMKKNNINFEYGKKNAITEMTSEKIPGVENANPPNTTAENGTDEIRNTDKIAEEKEITSTDKSLIKIKVLNGSGVQGASSKVASLLEKKGYTEISTGNATRFNYTETLISCATGVAKEVCEEVQSTLGDTYPAITNVDEKMDENTIQIIIGK
jgi:LysM repeat protein